VAWKRLLIKELGGILLIMVGILARLPQALFIYNKSYNNNGGPMLLVIKLSFGY
jgi:hypothetical protein